MSTSDMKILSGRTVGDCVLHAAYLYSFILFSLWLCAVTFSCPSYFKTLKIWNLYKLLKAVNAHRSAVNSDVCMFILRNLLFLKHHPICDPTQIFEGFYLLGFHTWVINYSIITFMTLTSLAVIPGFHFLWE